MGNPDNKCVDCGIGLSKFNLRLDPNKRPSRCHHCAAVLRMAQRDPREKLSILLTAAKAQLKLATRDGRIKYPDDPWPTISEVEHMEHAIQHMIAFMEGDRSEDHRAHAIWRLTAAVVVGGAK